MTDLIVRGVDWQRAANAARQFVKDYPEGRIGVWNCVIYSTDWSAKKGAPAMVVYRTKTAIVVRGSGKRESND